MKVAVLTRDYPPVASGISTHSWNLVTELRKAGILIDVFVGKTDAKTLLLPLAANLRDYDLVHAQSPPYGCLVRGSPLVVTVHSPIPSEFPGYGMILRLKSIPSVPLEAFSLRKARAVLTVSDVTRDAVTGLYGLPREKIVVIGNGVGKEFFAKNVAGRNERRIVMVSRLEPRKNVGEALSAICSLPPGSYEAQVVGTGSQLRMLSAFAAAKGASVKFLGGVATQELPAVYASAGIFLTTSLSEGFGLSLIEAMASGCAVVASNIGTHRALIIHGKNGMIYSNLAELRRILIQLLANPGMAQELGCMARRTAESFTWARVAGKTLEAYRRAVEQGSGQ